MGISVEVHGSRSALGAAAAERAAGLIRSAVAESGTARIIVATGNSQIDFIKALTSRPDVPWPQVEVFHMDEYAGMSESHPASFRRWVRERLVDRVHPGRVEYLAGDSADLAAECRRYADLLEERPVDVAFVGIGENGHIAFNDPHVADFHDPAAVKVVDLDSACRRQQVGEGHFASLDEVPIEALTLTCSALMRAGHLVCSVPESRKAAAVKGALEGPLTEACPASVLRTHPDAWLYLDLESASLLSR